MRHLLPIALLLAASSASARPDPAALSGTWVSAPLRAALASDAPADPDCHLEVLMEPSLRVFESCAEREREWTEPELKPWSAGRFEVVGDGGRRRIVLRAGTPNELERMSSSAEGEQRLDRLYRLPEELAPALAERLAARRLLAGRWKTEDGVELAFAADGTYVFAAERGRYRFAPGVGPEGTRGLLELRPEADTRRRHFVVADEDSLELLEVPAHFREQAPPAAEAAESEDAAAQPGDSAERVGDAVAKIGDAVAGVSDALVDAVAAGDRVGAAPAVGGGDEPAEEVEPAPEEASARPKMPDRATLATQLRLERVIELPPAPEEEPPALEEEAAGKEIPIRVPIEPAKKCGCGAGEGLVGGGLAALLLLAHRRRRGHDRA